MKEKEKAQTGKSKNPSIFTPKSREYEKVCVP